MNITTNLSIDVTTRNLAAAAIETNSQNVVSIELQDVTLAYRGHPAVHHVSGVFAPGSLTALIGPNGAGKSTLLRAMARQARPTQGHVIYNGLATNQPGTIAYLPQIAGLNPDFSLRVIDVVAMGAWQSIGAMGAMNTAIIEKLQAALQQVGLANFESRMVDELSVGQLQRVLFARLIMQDAPVILLDEPFNALDVTTVRDLLKIIHTWHAQGRLVVAVLHDMNTVKQHFPQTLLIARELLAWGATSAVVSSQTLGEAEQASLAWQDAAPWCYQPEQNVGIVVPKHEHSHHAH
jgi:zinc/manganese transport system ATP-binding protein